MHPSDARLQALIDGELDEPGSRRVLAHLESCEACRDRKRALELSLDETGELLRALDRPPPGRSVDDVIRVAEARSLPARSSGGGTLLRAASLAGLLVAGAVVAAVVPGSPIREAVERMVRGPVAEDVAAPPAADLWRREGGVALVPNGHLEVTFEAGQPQGAVELVMTGEDTARVEVRGDSVGFVVGDGSVLVRNRGTSASYRIAVPSDLPRVRILIGSRTVYEVAGGRVVRDESRQQGGARRLPLAEAP
jgi:hypothetical protein